jgi:histidinol-phosphate/aromatic aminotransferase/cobyric acid decarboxylase-like protein
VRDFEKGERNLEEMPNKIDILYITNPDNRFGLLINRERMQSISLETIRRGAICIIDEAYMDYAPNHSLVKSDMTNTVIVRTFAKFFSLESSRIGYIIGDRKIIKKLKDFIPQYPIATSSIEKLVETISIDEKELLVKREQCARKKEKFYRSVRHTKFPIFIHIQTS